jgi:hypothetical protein
VAGTDYWLYWDLNVSSGLKTYGHTTVLPVAQATAPVAPLNDQHWFDTSTMTMRVWNTAGNRWVRRIRVFACELSNGSVPVSMSVNAPVFAGTQAGASGLTSINAGALVFDADGGVLKRQNGTFFTTEDQAVTSVATSSQVKIGSLVVSATANATIPEYSFVRFSDYNMIDLASSFVLDNGAFGIVENDLEIGDTANVVMEGIVSNADWDFSTGTGINANFVGPVDVNAPLYVDAFGQLTPTPPATPIVVATVIDMNSILLRPSSLFLDTTNDPATTTDLGTVTMSVVPVDPDAPIAVGDNDPRVTSTLAHIASTTVHLTADQNTFLDALNLPTLVAADVNQLAGITVLETGDLGVSVQDWDADLDAVAAITAGDGLVRRAAGVWSVSGEPANQIVFGTGTDVDSDADLTYTASGANDGQLFVNTTTGTGPQGSVSSTSPAKIAIYGVSNPDGTGGDVDIWAGYGTAGVNNGVGGNLNLWAGGGGGGPTTQGGSLNLWGGEAEATGGNVNITGGNATTGPSAGNVNITGGSTVDDGGTVSITGGAPLSAIVPGDGGDVIISGGQSGSPGIGGDVFVRGGTGTTETGNVELGSGETDVTRDGDMMFIPTSAGVPTGTPSGSVGLVPLVYDTSNNRLYVFSGGTWRQVTLAA